MLSSQLLLQQGRKEKEGKKGKAGAGEVLSKSISAQFRR